MLGSDPGGEAPILVVERAAVCTEIVARAVEAALTVMVAPACPAVSSHARRLIVDRGCLSDLRLQLAQLDASAQRGEVVDIVWVPLARRRCLAPESFGVGPTPLEDILEGLLRARVQPDIAGVVARLRRAADLLAEGPVPHDHAAAIKPLWDGAFCFRAGASLPPVVVVVDDDEEFLQAATRQLGGACELKVFESFDGWLNSPGCSVERVDLFLIDLVEGEGGRSRTVAERPGPVLTGLKEVLPRLRRERGLSDFPQLYALSALPVEKAGHIALRLGADYYLDKTLFLAHPDPASLLGGLLWHTTYGLRVLRTLGLPNDHREWPGWTALESEVGNDRATDTKAMVWSLFSAHHRLTQVDLIERLSGELSGGMVLSVQPRLSDGAIGGEGLSRAMAPRVVKRDRWRKMAHEWSAYRAHIAPLTTSGFARVEPFFRRSERDAMISYTLAGSSKGFALGQIVSLGRRMLSRQEQVPAIVRRVFAELLEPLHTSAAAPATIAQVVRFMATELKPVDVAWPGTPEGKADPNPTIECDIVDSMIVDGVDVFRVEYLPLPDQFPLAATDMPIPAAERWLVRPGKRMKLPRPARLLVAPGPSFRHEVVTASHAGRIRTSPELLECFMNGLDALEGPGQAIARFEDTLREALTLDSPFSYWSVVHGDLNIENVLCDEGSGEFWAIDFAKTGFGPPAIDYITFEVACRMDVLAGEFFKSYLPSGSSPSEWLAQGRLLIESFEKSVSETGRVDFGALAAGRRSEEVEARVRVGWQAVLVARQLAFDGYYRGASGRLVYDLLLALYCLRALQRYRTLVTSEHAPVGALWIQVLFERSAAGAAVLMRTLGKATR